MSMKKKLYILEAKWYDLTYSGSKLLTMTRLVWYQEEKNLSKYTNKATLLSRGLLWS